MIKIFFYDSEKQEYFQYSQLTEEQIKSTKQKMLKSLVNLVSGQPAQLHNGTEG